MLDKHNIQGFKLFCGFDASSQAGTAEIAKIHFKYKVLQELRVGISLHWTEKMFIEHGDLFLKYVNDEERFQRELEALESIFSEARVPTGGRVLDLCCGLGMQALNLTKKGFNVTGVDFSPIAIKCAEELAGKMGLKNRVEFLIGDARRVSELLEKKSGFDAIISMGTSIGYYDDDTDKSIIEQLNKLALSKGVLVVDVNNRDYVMKHHEPLGVVEFDDFEVHDHRRLKLERSHAESIWEFYEKDGEDLKHVFTVSSYCRLYSLHELVRFFEMTGWKYVKSYGNFDLEPVTADTPRIIIVGKKG
jgi:SAM-dependent methyltransferase